MKQLETDIKNKVFKNLYVLYGPQSYNRKRYLDALVGIFLPQGDTMNITRFSGKKIDMNEVSETVSTMPFLAEKRVVVLEDTGLFTKACEELSDLLANIPETCVVIFSEEKIDSRLKQTKTAKTAGTVAEFANLSEEELRKWIMGKLSKEHRPITRDALDLFMERCGDDMWQISNELEKVISYTFGKDGIRAGDIEAVCPPLAEDKIFAMIDAILDHDTSRALTYYKDLLLLRSEPLRILSLVRDQLRLMLHVLQMNEEHLNTKQMSEALGNMKETRVKLALSAARKSSKSSLTGKINMCALADEKLKSGLMDPQIAIETLLVSLCPKDQKTA